MKESDLVAKILGRVRGPGAWAEKIHGSQYSKRGIPDIIGCYRGHFFALEVKRDSKARVTPLQSYTLEQIRSAGGFAFVVRGLDDLEQILRSIKVF